MGRWFIEGIEKEIISYLDNHKKVYIDYGCLVDQIISYKVTEYPPKHSWQSYTEKEVIFFTTGSILPKEINLKEPPYDTEVDTEECNDNLFVHLYTRSWRETE